MDVRQYDWSPEFNWPAKVVDTTVAKWSGAFSSELKAEATRARPVLGERREARKAAGRERMGVA
jgi:hypothetical protein